MSTSNGHARTTGPRTTRRRASGSGTSGSTRARTPRSAPATALAEIKHDVVSLGSDAVRLVHGLEEAAVEKVTAITRRSKDEVRGVHEQVKSYIAQRPIASVLVAAGVGALAAKLIRWR